MNVECGFVKVWEHHLNDNYSESGFYQDAMGSFMYLPQTSKLVRARWEEGEGGYELSTFCPLPEPKVSTTNSLPVPF